MDLAPFFAAFVLIFLAELGDKTMITVITLSSKHSRRLVLSASVLALAAVSLIGVLVGQVLYDLVPAYIVTLAAGVLFIAFGLATVLLPEKEGREPEERRAGALGAFGGIFALMALMEMGDKTQLSIIALSAQYGAPLLVLLGAVAAFALVTLAGVMLGAEIGRRVPQRHIKLGSAAVFIIFGAVFLAQALLGMGPF